MKVLEKLGAGNGIRTRDFQMPQETSASFSIPYESGALTD